MDTVTAKYDSITQNGNIILEAGKEYTVQELIKKDAWYGARSGTFYPESIQFIKLSGFDEVLFLPSSFIETSQLN